jgi:hypothetical protein
MSRKNTIGALIVGLAVLAGPTTGAAYAKGPVDLVREAHARHMRVIHKIEAAHERHVSHAPRPVREVHKFVHQRHRAHVRAVHKAERYVERRHAEHVRDVRGAVAVVDRHHREHRRALGVHRVESDVASVGASVNASVERAHERHVNALERFADWLVGAT